MTTPIITNRPNLNVEALRLIWRSLFYGIRLQHRRSAGNRRIPMVNICPPQRQNQKQARRRGPAYSPEPSTLRMKKSRTLRSGDSSHEFPGRAHGQYALDRSCHRSTTRWAISKMEANSWETITMVVPRLRFKSFISLSSSAEVIGSSPAEGSSKKSTLGSRAMALARPALFIMPPEISEGRWFSYPARFTRASFSLASLLAASLERLVCVQKRQHDVFYEGERAQKSAGLEKHSDLAAHLFHRLFIGVGYVYAVLR